MLVMPIAPVPSPRPEVIWGTAETRFVLDVPLPDREDLAPVVRGFAGCLASITEVPLAELVPEAADSLVDAIGQWRAWLAGRGAGLVAIAQPTRFNWPGYWIAVLAPDATEANSDPVAVVMFGTPAGVVLAPQAPALVGSAAFDLPIQQGYVVAPLDPALPSRASYPAQIGQVEAIALAARATEPVVLVPEAQAAAGRGLIGDRYAAGAGTFTPVRGGGRGYDLTLVEAEVLDELVLPGGRRLAYEQARRNLITRGVDLNSLVGRRFRVGNVECFGQRLCEPCAHLERLTTKGVLRGLIHRGGLRADILTDGPIRVGDTIYAEDG
jgi:MOSC domain-containing protein YiiM